MPLQGRFAARGVTVEEMTEYGYSVEVPEGYDEAVIRTRMALRGEGFSILTEMNVGGMLGPEAGDARQYLIMGIWNSALSQSRLDESLQMAVHLPCNVVVQEQGSTALVAVTDPVDVVEGADPAARPFAEAARAALGRVLERVKHAPA